MRAHGGLSDVVFVHLSGNAQDVCSLMAHGFSPASMWIAPWWGLSTWWLAPCGAFYVGKTKWHFHKHVHDQIYYMPKINTPIGQHIGLLRNYYVTVMQFMALDRVMENTRGGDFGKGTVSPSPNVVISFASFLLYFSSTHMALFDTHPSTLAVWGTPPRILSLLLHFYVMQFWM